MQQLSHSIRTKQCSYCLRQLRWSTTQAETASKPPASAKEASTSKAAWIPPPLPRPLGIRHTERSVPLSKQEKREDRIQKNAATRKLLVGELNKGYFGDFADVQKTGGKAWIAPETVIRADRALYFPELQGTTLSDKETRSTSQLLKDKVSLVAMITNQISLEHVDSYLKPILKYPHDKSERFQVVQLNLQENPLKSFLLSLFLSNLRRVVPQEQHNTYLLVSQNLELFREPLGMSNKAVGYVYLVDGRCRIRWAAVAHAIPKEIEGLTSCINVLTTRLKSGKDE